MAAMVIAAWMAGRASGQGVTPHTTLGKFDVGSFHGSVELQDYGDRLAVALGVDNPAPVRRVPVEVIQVWLLLSNGNTATLRSRNPSEQDARQLGFSMGGRGGVVTQVHFTFEKVEGPVAVVLKFGDEFRLFPIRR